MINKKTIVDMVNWIENHPETTAGLSAGAFVVAFAITFVGFLGFTAYSNHVLKLENAKLQQMVWQEELNE